MSPPEGSPEGTIPAIDTRHNNTYETVINNVVAERKLELNQQTIKIKSFGFPEVPDPK
jgi:hypothetical protein